MPGAKIWGMTKIIVNWGILGNTNQKKAGVAMLISKKYKGERQHYYWGKRIFILIKGFIHQGDITNLNL